MQKILLAEDDTFILDMYKEKFSSSGFEITAVKNGEEALLKIKDSDYDLILLDVMMPKLNGFEVLKMLRKDGNPKKATTPVIMLTNLGQKSDIEQGLDVGANDYIVKSNSTPGEVLIKINALLKKQPES